MTSLEKLSDDYCLRCRHSMQNNGIGKACFVLDPKREGCFENGSPQFFEPIAETDVIEHPPHYTSGNIETIDIIRDSVENFESYLHGNVIKYVSRYRFKNGIQDLKKASVYLNWLIDELNLK